MANKMQAVRELVSVNPQISPKEIVKTLAKQKIKMTTTVASNYKSVLKRSGKKRGPKAKKSISGRTITVSNGGLEELIAAAKSLGWKKVKDIAESVLEAPV